MHLVFFLCLLYSIFSWIMALNTFPIDGNCYLCPPGYFFAGQKTPNCRLCDSRPVFPVCKKCPARYYNSNWSFSTSCKIKTECDSILNMKKVYDGGTTNDDVCACIDGYKWDSESRDSCSEIIRSEADVSPHCPTCTIDATSNSYADDPSKLAPSVTIIGCIGISFVCFFLGCLVGFFIHKFYSQKNCCKIRQRNCGDKEKPQPQTEDDSDSSSNKGDQTNSQLLPSRTENDNASPLERAFLICEAHIYGNDAHDFLRYGLKLKSKTVIDLEQNYQSSSDRMIMHGLLKWRNQCGRNASVDALLAVLKEVDFREVLQKIENELGITEDRTNQSTDV